MQRFVVFLGYTLLVLKWLEKKNPIMKGKLLLDDGFCLLVNQARGFGSKFSKAPYIR